MVSSWIYVTLGVMVALIVLGVVAVNTAVNKSEWFITDQPSMVAKEELESLGGREDAEMRVQGYEECINNLPG